MNQEKNELEALCDEIEKIISDNSKFLARVMDEDFEPEDGETEEEDLLADA
ncbi:MAG TPA: hypothetical protein VF775_04185 [Geobacteraceae bacterium]